MEDILSLFPVKNHSFYGKHKTEYSKRVFVTFLRFME